MRQGSGDSRLVSGVRRRAADFVAAGDVLRPGERVLLLLSGGPDSMALLDLVGHVDRRLGLGLTLSALHVDYATRGAASARDRRIVEDACRALGLPLHVVRLARKPGGAGFQERARRIRYDAGREVLARGEADIMATAHNRDDQAETVLYRLIKYAAPSSLRAMRPRDGDLARPLLCLGADELRTYCRACGIAFGHDESNDTVDYARNLLRHRALPVLREINPRVSETLADAATLADEERVVIERAVDEAWRRVARPGVATGDWRLDVAALAAEPRALRTLCLRRLVRTALGDDALVERRLTERLERLAADTRGSRSLSLGRGFEAAREYGLLTVRRRAGTHACPPAALVLRPLDLPRGPVSAAGGVDFCGRRFRAELLAGGVFERAAGEAWLGVAAPPAGLVVRHPRRGERMRPLGLAAEVLLSDLFSAARVPRAERARAIVAELDGRVAWVSPGRTSEWFRVTPRSPYTLHVYEEAT